jgi:hypothetical protein
MKNSIVPTVVCCLIFAAYVAGQSNQKPVEPCCCKHQQQIAEDLHWIRESMSKPFVPPPDIKGIGDLPAIEKLEPAKFNFNEPNIEPINFPKLPNRKTNLTPTK